MSSSCLSEEVRRLLDAADAKYHPASAAVKEALERHVNSAGIDFHEELMTILQINTSSEERSEEWFRDSILRSGPVFQRCLFVVRSGIKWDSSWLQWLSAPKRFGEEFQRFRGCEDDFTVMAPMRALLLCTPILERSLGNLLLAISPAGSLIPPLLRDLVNSESLKFTIGTGNAAMLSILFGSPKSLNLRNILWHGFAAPGEVRPALAAAFFSLAFSIGSKLVKDKVAGKVQPRQAAFKNLSRIISKGIQDVCVCVFY